MAWTTCASRQWSARGAKGNGVNRNPRILNLNERFRINKAVSVGKQHNAFAGVRLVLDGTVSGLQGQTDVGAAMRRFDSTDGVIPGRSCRVSKVEQGSIGIAEKHDGHPGIDRQRDTGHVGRDGRRTALAGTVSNRRTSRAYQLPYIVIYVATRRLTGRFTLTVLCVNINAVFRQQCDDIGISISV